MDRGEVETHRLQELEVDFGAGRLAEFDLRVAGDAAKDEPCVHIEERVWCPVRSIRRVEQS
jgi:hypothetical protein